MGPKLYIACAKVRAANDDSKVFPTYPDGMTRTENSVLDAVTQILRDLTAEPELRLEPSTILRDLPHWDSMKQIEAIAMGEETFGVDVHFRDIDRIFTVGDLIAAILRARPS